jgi:hypothetical protein
MGIAAAALIVSFPTWLTLVARAGNDALACAFAAAGVAITASRSQGLRAAVAEAVLWAAAIATKLYTWPVLIVPVVIWVQQRASRSRIALVSGAVLIAAVVTLADLRSRTGNLFGVVAFDRPGGARYDAAMNFGEIFRVTIATAAWTSGEHWNAMTPFAMAICFGPVLAACGYAGLRYGERRFLLLAAIALAAFAAAQAFNVASCLMARRAGNPVPIGGKEGWYWFVLAPVVIPVLLSPVLKRAWGAAVVLWIVSWDVIVHECMLFHDFAGSTSPANPTALFRWGPLHAPFTVSLSGIGVGPFVEYLIALRAVHLLSLTALLGLAMVRSRVAWTKST